MANSDLPMKFKVSKGTYTFLELWVYTSIAIIEGFDLQFSLAGSFDLQFLLAFPIIGTPLAFHLQPIYKWFPNQKIVSKKKNKLG
ncbi:MAG: hypothetical protein GX179_01580 [Candidatus Cloacimonetes bacterium]|nr:hypothetical protein [Candidatus Cloacimonadota bacterium]